jgi:hypothetical protein
MENQQRSLVVELTVAKILSVSSTLQRINQNHFVAAIAFVWFGEVAFEVDTGKATAPAT